MHTYPFLACPVALGLPSDHVDAQPAPRASDDCRVPLRVYGLGGYHRPVRPEGQATRRFSGRGARRLNPHHLALGQDGADRWRLGPGILSFLRSKNACPLDMILLTHRHADHLGGLVHVIESCGARLYLDAPYPHESNIYAKLLRVLESRQVPVRQAERGRIIELGDGARLLFLGPPSPIIKGADSDVNANSVVSRLDFGKGSVLFAADAEELAESWLLESGANLSATVLKVGHHGSRHSSTLRFLKAVMPLAAVISTEAGDAKHPHPDTLSRLAQVGALVFRTDLDGTIGLDMDGESL